MVSLDTNKVKNYVFATNKLKEIVGASSLLAELNEEITIKCAKKHEGKCIFAGGGSALFVFYKKNKAHDFVAEIERTYIEKTKKATIASAIVEIPQSQEENNFIKALNQAEKCLKRKKANNNPSTNLVYLEPYFEPCHHCGNYPIIKHIELNDNDLLLCEVCFTKRSYALKVENENLRPRKYFIDYFSKLNQGLKFPNTLEELGEMDRSNGYIAYIYADGNAFGNFIQKHLDSEEKLTAFSEILKSAINTTIAKSIEPFIQNNKFPFIPVLIGGDDLILITPGSRALSIANNFLIQFQQFLQNGLRDKNLDIDATQLSMSMGVTISHSKYPLLSFHDMSKSLLQNAKSLYQDIYIKSGKQISTVDFKVISSSTSKSLDQIIDGEYKLSKDHWATCRPYPCFEVEGFSRPTFTNLLNVAATLSSKHFPKNKLMRWKDIVYTKESINALELISFGASLKMEEKILMETSTKSLGLATYKNLFFQENFLTTDYFTPLIDLVEIFNFV